MASTVSLGAVISCIRLLPFYMYMYLLLDGKDKTEATGGQEATKGSKERMRV